MENEFLPIKDACPEGVCGLATKHYHYLDVSGKIIAEESFLCVCTGDDTLHRDGTEYVTPCYAPKAGC